MKSVINRLIEQQVSSDGVLCVGKKSCKDFVWISLLDKTYNTEDGHFEICWDDKSPHQAGCIYAEFHYETQKGVDKYKHLFDNEQLDILEVFPWEKGFGCHLTNDCCVQINGNLHQCIERSVKQLYKLYGFIKHRLKMEEYVQLLEENYNIILHGAPGTGKTFLAWEIAEKLIVKKQGVSSLSEADKKDQVKFVQFHPSYDYTDFVEGLRPTKPDKNGIIGFNHKNGVFKDLCKTALDNDKKTFVFIIDEINRGEISKIFGELFFSIDPGYRGNERVVETQYQNLIEDAEKEGFKDGFFVPKNVYLIGTMNDIDRSVESMDFAFRRRFTFVEITAKESQSILDRVNAWGIDTNGKSLKPDESNLQKIKNRMDNLNNKIWYEAKDEENDDESGIEGLSSSYHIGAAYFLKIVKYIIQDTRGNIQYDFNNLWRFHLRGLLKEYLRGMEEANQKLIQLETAFNDDKINQ